VDKDATQTQPEGWLDEEVGGMGVRGGIEGNLDAKIDQTQRTDDEGDDGSDGDSSGVGSSSLSLSSKSVAKILYNNVVLLSLARHNPVGKFRIIIFDTKSKLSGFFQDYFFGSDNAVDLGVCAADGYPGIIATIRKHIMTAEFLSFL